MTTPPVTTFASLGDSISALADNNGAIIWWSWVRDAVGLGGLKYIGVYMRAGATTTEMLQKSAPTLATAVVFMGGTNDVAGGISTQTTLNNITATFAKTGGTYKIVSAVAPRSDGYRIATNALNVALEQWAAYKGYIFIDPWTSVRAPDGSYLPGTNSDAVHPSNETGQIVGQIMHDKILELTS